MSDREDPLAEEGLGGDVASDVHTIARGGAVQIAGQLSSRGLAVVFSSVAVRVLGAPGYGLYRQVAQTLAFGAQLGLAGFNYASMRFIARARAVGDHGAVRGSARVGLAGAAAASALAAAALLLGADEVAGLFADSPPQVPEVAGLLRLGALYIPCFALMQVLRYCTQAYKTMVPSVIVGNLIQPFVRFVLGVGALLAGFAVAGAVTTLVASVAVGALAGGFYLGRMLTEAERRAAPEARVGEMVRFALPQAGSSMLGIQTLGLGVLVLGVFGTDAQVGLFGIALSLQGPGTLFLGGIVNIWAPVVSELHGRGDIAQLGSLYQTINRWIATFSFPVFAALMVEPDAFVRLFAGDEGRGAAAVVAILAAGNIFYTGTGPTGYVLSMTGRPGINFVNSACAVVLYVALGAWVVPEHGAAGMAAVDAGVTAVVNLVRVVEARVLVGVQPFGRTFFKPVAATAGGAAVLLAWRLFPGDSVALDLGGLAVAGLVYVAALRALGMDAEERAVLERIKRRGLRGRGRADVS
ncbi:MAG TPA: oligosaccharide flippase family protein [Actinomycetota bacterium]|nr:oligosaccharide flippase family protein [Actinomycetota bacterium]